MPLPPTTIARRFLLWLVVCSVSAAPSFFWGQALHADVPGMVAAICLFVGLYTAVTCTPWFEALRRRPFVRETLYVGYGLRLFASLCMALALLPPQRGLAVLGFLVWPDLFGGMISLRLAGLLLGQAANFEEAASTFAGALLTTCIQGALLNVIVFVVMAITYGLQRAFRKHPNRQPRGFEVELPLRPISGSEPAAEAIVPRSRVE